MSHNKIDSNNVGLSIAEETTIKVLPGTPVWRRQEPNSFADFGGVISTTERSPINPERQVQKGVVTDLDASGGFNTDMTNLNLQRLLQGFLFADAREKMSTAPFNGTAIPITAVDGSGEDYEAASGLDGFAVGHLVFASGFTNTENNGLKRVTTAAAASLVVAEDLVTEASPPALAYLDVAGFQAATADLDVVVTATTVSLTSTVLDFTTLGLNVGEWIFVGGDLTIEQFVNNAPGYARISSIAANALVFDKTTWTAVNETGTALTIRLFFGKVIRNEDVASSIIRRSYQLERTLGNDDNGVQSEYITGAVASELTINFASADKTTADLTYMAADHEVRTGTVGVKSGTRVEPIKENAINTTSNVFQTYVAVEDGTLNPLRMFNFLTDYTITINNNIAPNKAIGTLGAFDLSAGNFNVSGSLTAYFVDTAALSSIRNNADVSMNTILAEDNMATIIDIPLMSLSGGNLTVEPNEAIKIPVDNMAAENTKGYTLLMAFLPYVPNVALPS